jgi:hypothetical protein
MLKIEDVDVKVKKLIYGNNCSQVRAEPSYISNLNEEEVKLMTLILGSEWMSLVLSLTAEELEAQFYETYPDCPDLRLIGSKFIS